MAKTKPATTAGNKKNVVKKPEAGLPAAMEELAEMTGQGFEDADKDAFAIPFLRILQPGSPQVDENEPSYIKGAKPGMFFNTITGHLFGNKIQVIPIHYGRDFIEWKPGRKGFVKAHGPDPAILKRVVEIDDKNNSILDNGNIIQDTRNHFVLLVGHERLGPIILSMFSSGIKHSRKWMTLLNNLAIPDSDKTAPMFGGVWEIETVKNENDDGKWHQIGNKNSTLVAFVSWVTQAQLEAAVACRDLLKSGEAEADWESTIDKKDKDKAQPEEGVKKGKDDIPF